MVSDRGNWPASKESQRMSFHTEIFTMGVEEEYQIVDIETRELSSTADMLLQQARPTLGDCIQPELNLSQVESVSPICHSLSEVRQVLMRMRRELDQFAQQIGTRIAAAGTHPFSHWKTQKITPKERYQNIAKDYQQLALEPYFGYHVHVGVEDEAIALQILNRARAWLGALLALSANSPFWLGDITGYASYRTLLWSQWATSGPPLTFASLAEYQELAQAMINIGAIEDPSKLYWDVRLSARFSTIEFRMADACTTIDTAVMLAGLIRALVATLHSQVLRHDPVFLPRPEVVRMAHWQAARYGLSGNLIDVIAQRQVPASTLISQLLDFVRPALEESGDWSEVSHLVHETLRKGTGADRQLAIYQQAGSLEDVVDFIIAETIRGTL
jgi:carboxylate-amine ligase